MQREPKVRPRGLTELNRQTSEFREIDVVKICEAGYQGKGTCRGREREIQRAAEGPFEFLSEFWSTHA